MLPISGPYSKQVDYLGPPTSTGFRPPWYQKISSWYRQSKPYNLPLPYTMVELMVTKFKHGIDNPYFYVQNAGAPRFIPSLSTDGYNKAYSKLVAALGDSSLWAVNLAEHHQMYDLIAKDGIVLMKFARALHKFDFVSASRILKTQLPKGLKSTAKAFGNNFLKFHFGWEPLVNDIGAAVSTLQNPYPSKRISGKGSVEVAPFKTGATNPSERFTQIDTYSQKSKIQCTVRVTNPNLYLASQLGFVNPLAVAWELVPFSFVVDWFVNVGQFLSQVTDFAGVSTDNVAVSSLQVNRRDEIALDGFFPGSDTSWSASYSGTFFSRSLGLPGVTLKVRPWKGVSPVRAATAISLLVQQLR